MATTMVVDMGGAAAGGGSGAGVYTGIGAGAGAGAWAIAHGHGWAGIGGGQWEHPAATIKAPVLTRTGIRRLERTILHLSWLLFAQCFRACAPRD
ncbi:MAG TPA: hypothetical protein VF550_15045 [Polyangia bacterium]